MKGRPCTHSWIHVSSLPQFAVIHPQCKIIFEILFCWLFFAMYQFWNQQADYSADPWLFFLWSLLLVANSLQNIFKKYSKLYFLTFIDCFFYCINFPWLFFLLSLLLAANSGEKIVSGNRSLIYFIFSAKHRHFDYPLESL